MPPPCCMVRAASLRPSKMPASESSMPAHDEAVEQRHVARRAGAGEDAAGRQEAVIREQAVENLRPSAARSAGFSASATRARRRAARCPRRLRRRACRPASLKRYFMSQMSRAIGSAVSLRCSWPSSIYRILAMKSSAVEKCSWFVPLRVNGFPRPRFRDQGRGSGFQGILETGREVARGQALAGWRAGTRR